MEMTEHGKAMADVTFTITESTPSGNSYLKYWGERPISAVVAVPSSLGWPGVQTLSHAGPCSPAAARPWR